jgi:ankyrin
MVRFLLQHGASVDNSTSVGYTPLHQAAQQGHTLIISLLREHKAKPNAVTNVSVVCHSSTSDLTESV